MLQLKTAADAVFISHDMSNRVDLSAVALLITYTQNNYPGRRLILKDGECCQEVFIQSDNSIGLRPYAMSSGLANYFASL